MMMAGSSHPSRLDLERPSLIDGIQPTQLDVSDRSGRGPLTKPCGEAVDRTGWTLSLHDDAAVRGIGDPPRQAEALRQPSR